MKKVLFLSLAFICLYSSHLMAQETKSSSKSDSVQTKSDFKGNKSKKYAGKLTEEEKETAKQLLQEKAANMSPEEKKALREKMKKRVEEMSPEERQEMGSALKKKFENLSPEEKQQLMEKMKNRNDSTGGNIPRRKRRN
jgi:RNA binding exosome subunit